MKKLTIFRTGEYETLSGKLLKKSACEMFALAKEVRQEYGVANLIISSHIPEAMNSARIIRQVMNDIKIAEQPRLSRYHAGRAQAFKEDFLWYVQYFCSYFDHIILVSHSMNISQLANLYVARGFSVTLENADWNSIFDLSTSHVSAQAERLAQKGCEVDTISESLTTKEKELIASLSYVAD